MSKNVQAEMKRYSDERIINIIKQENFFGAVSVDTAKSIALERGLLTEEQLTAAEQEVAEKVADRRAVAYEPKYAGGIYTIGTFIFLLILIIKWTIRFLVHS